MPWAKTFTNYILVFSSKRCVFCLQCHGHETCNLNLTDAGHIITTIINFVLYPVRIVTVIVVWGNIITCLLVSLLSHFWLFSPTALSTISLLLSMIHVYNISHVPGSVRWLITLGANASGSSFYWVSFIMLLIWIRALAIALFFHVIFFK